MCLKAIVQNLMHICTLLHVRLYKHAQKMSHHGMKSSKRIGNMHQPCTFLQAFCYVLLLSVDFETLIGIA